jgi:transcriptional regulator with XRE-family HTH domain
MSGGNQFAAGAQARALGNHPGATVPTATPYPPRPAAVVSLQRSAAERSATFRTAAPGGACPPSSDGIPASGNVALDRSNVPSPVPGPQFLVRAQSMCPVTGRPEAAEQEQIAGSVGALLQQLRGERRMSLRDLEARSGVARSTISRVERGLRRPRRSMLGWLAWGLDAENVVPLTRQLAEAAGDSLIADSRWSARTHARHAADALYRGTLPVPLILLAPRAVDALSGVLPDEIERLRQVQAHARDLPWPPGLEGSPEALAVMDALAGIPRHKLAAIGRAAVKINDFGAMKDRQRRERERKAEEREVFRRNGGYRARLKMPAGIL